MRIVGYSALESLPTESAGSVVYRATRDSDGMAVILKTPRGRLTRTVRDRFTREHAVLRHVAGPGVIGCLGLEEHDGAPVLVLSDRGPRDGGPRDGGLRSLDTQLRGHPLPVVHALVVARGIAEALARVHARQVVHKDVNPANVLASSDGRQVVLIDFGIASRVSRERATGASAEVLEGTLAYLAPEQSGRMNRSVDWRSDLYALGATLYEMITGRPPFSEADPLAMVHAHIARTPPTPTELQPRIPEVVSDIVMRLLRKSAEDRYQSADGLSADLARCIAALDAGAALDGFPLGTADVRRGLEPSPRLYGRADEMTLLERAFDRVKAGAVEVVRVSGEPGVGKTALVLELRERITPLGGALATGKCDQLDRSAPFSVLAQAFRQRARMVLSQSDAEVQRVTELVRAMPPEHLALLAASAPELARFVEGALPLPAILPPSESEARLSVAARRLVRCFASPEAPLVLFLDDLQWADGATLRLLSMLASDPEASHVMIIAAHRDHGMTKGHPLLVALADLAARGTKVTDIALSPLAQLDVVAFLADTLRTSQSDAGPLAEVLYQRTSGNPFFLLQMLEALDEAGAVHFDANTRRFALDPEEVRRITVRADVAELLAQRLGRLSERAVAAIEGAALIGAQFEAGPLAALMDSPVEEITAVLAGPVEHGLIEVLDARSPERSAWRYGFVHDRVQQIAAERMPAERAVALHLLLGRMLLPSARDSRDARLFAAVDHLDAGRAQMTDPSERAELIELNLEAGIRARSAGAYPAALAYFEVGRALSRERSGGASSALDISLALEAAEAAYLATDFEKMEQLSEEVIAGSAHVLDRVRAHEVRVNAWIGKNDLERALAEGIDVLRLLDIDLPLSPHKGHVLAGLARTRFALSGYDADRIATLPAMSRPEALAVMRIAMGLGSPAYYARPDLLPLLVFSMIRTTLKDGVSSESSFAFALWGLVMASLGAIETGYSFGLLALRLKDRTDDVRTGNRADHLHHAHLVFWKHPYAEARAGLRRTYETGYTSGDLEYSAFSAMMSCAISLYAGFELSALVEDMRGFRDAIRSLAMGTSLYTHEISMQAALCLRGAADGDGRVSESPWEMNGPIYDARALLEVHEKANDATNLFSYRVAKALLCVVFGRPDDAEVALAWNRAHPDLAASTVISQMSIYLDVLASLMRARTLGPVARAALVLRVDRQIGTLRKWAELCSANWTHRLDLALAERAMVAGREQEASTLHERAIAGARAQGDMLDEALACERAAALHRTHGRSTAEQAYLSAARDAYERWGADAKVGALERSFPELLVDRGRGDARRTMSGVGPSTGPVSASAIDVSAFVASAQAIGKEMMLSRLVEALVRIALTAAGASRAVLLLERNGGLVAVAECVASPEVVVRTVEVPIEDDGDAPFVAATAARFAQRSRTDVVLDDAQTDAGWRRDPYVVRTGVRSLLCVPVEQQGKLSAVLHLEHGTAAGVFTHERVALLRVLSSQAAISLENARLYEDLQVTADAQARFVPKQFLESLSRPSIVDVRLGDHVRKSMTVLFSDIRGFTPLVERMQPEEHIGFINEYLRHMEPPILRAGGFVDSYIGDAIMALFDGAEGGADEALEGAVGMARALLALNEERRSAGAAPLRVGIGLHTGPLTLGTIGGPERMKCGVIGETVNLASRLEALTKAYDSTLLVSDHLVANLKRNDVPAMRVVDRVRMRGSAIPVTVYEVIDAEPPALEALRRAGLSAYNQGLDAYYGQRFADAIEALESARHAWPDDPAAARYLARARRLVREPVADDWTGVEQA